ncbi:hypothetical protein [Ferruginibacter sp. SUN106]|uniref:hypothetical protein n=1 Tax=Ferruginibacter sp. SUN106 TaxID=2978348 RepID=UPI003D35F0DE
MTLEDFIESRNEVDENLIIFQVEELNINSEIALFEMPDEESFEIVRNDIRYVYLIEVFIAKEFISGWLNNIGYKPTQQEMTQTLFDYSINDA